MTRYMIFYHPLKWPENIDSGSKVHLWNMLKAFKSNDYHVELISGYPKQRRAKMNWAIQKQKKGAVYDFVFTESPSLPSLLNRRNFFSPFLDMQFFKWCQEKSIPIGLFYGDIHWKFSHYKKTVRQPRRFISTMLYLYDWHLYTKFITHLFLPSLEMNKFLPMPWRKEKVDVLYPGCEISENKEKCRELETPNNHLKLLYVGGVTPPLYDLSPLFELMEKIHGVKLFLCCRRKEWIKIKNYYEPYNQNVIDIVHSSGWELKNFYRQTDLFALLWEANPYLSFAMPVKIFEALGYGKPIIALEGTEASKFIKEEDIGWVHTSLENVIKELEKIRENPDILRKKEKVIKEKRKDHQWVSRAKKVIQIMTKKS